jgi:sulfoxide reductase catalytic subunit YedY
MFIHSRDPLAPVGGTETPQAVATNRRKFLKLLGLGSGIAAAGGLGFGGYRLWRGTDEQVIEAGRRPLTLPEAASQVGMAPRDLRFSYGRAETVEAEAARYTNFYEFSSFKSSWRLVGDFQPDPWEIAIDGLCRNPIRLGLAEFVKRHAASLTERQYRHRCVETWAMAVPWTGIPLADVLKAADPLPQATHIRFVSFHRPDQAPGIAASPDYPWPYAEGLTLAEASNELVLLATGMYGHPLLKQHGAPIRVVVPWKYGYKSIKSVERIELVDRQPETFWSTLNPEAYPFRSNVDPDEFLTHSQRYDHMLGTGEVLETQLYNGYGSYVAHLYQS